METLWGRRASPHILSASSVQANPPAFPEASLEPIDPFNLTSFALALLLAFRLDASYNRYMRGRELWGTVVCDSRDLVRKVWSCAA